jgi:anti-anti-sigma factor
MGREVIVLVGELDLAAEEAFAVQVAATSAEVVEVDASGLTFIDSTGLRSLLNAREQLARQGRRLTIGKRSPALDRLLDVSRAAGLFDD